EKKDRKGFEIKIKNLSYFYEDTQVQALQDINLEIRSGERIGIIGAAESGKTTLINVLTGLLPSYKGTVAFDGISLRDINLNSLRDHIGENLNTEDIFDGTIEQNITVGKNEISLERIFYSIEVVGLTDFVHRQPEGIRTKLVAGGKNLPSSVVKKIILARCIVENPSLIVFDDFFGSIEPLYKEKILDYFFDPKHTWTIIGVSYNPIFLKRCDRIVILEAGKIKAIGTFNELSTNPLYQSHFVN
ncbi:MAG: ABC transporter ATP-binding protein/permease, partial [Bacteroidia bacterium]|nr:ABC transporter ATP-binding protein/permease [Bacteroidia bacterium]